jgi:hypothetical protein
MTDPLFNGVDDVSATYNAAAIRAIIDETPSTSETDRAARHAQALVQVSEVAQPVYQDTLAVDGVDWTVDSNFVRDDNYWLLFLYTGQRARW